VFLSSFVSAAIDPMSYTIHFFTMKILYLDTIGSQFLYFSIRAALFIGALVLLVSARKNEPNKAPEPTPTAVTSPAAQEPRQP
jgi:hypothetical protein